MNRHPSSPLRLLQSVESAAAAECKKIRALLSPAPSVARIVFDRPADLLSPPHRRLLEKTAASLAGSPPRDAAGDWPFEHFWENPGAHRHTRMLAHLLHPSGAHGTWPLRKFFELSGHAFPVDDSCAVHADPSGAEIIIRRLSEPVEAVVIDNRMHGSSHRRGELQMDISRIQEEGFDPAAILVLHLHSTAAGRPDPDDAAFIRKRGVRAGEITCEENILPWLDTLLEADWPETHRENIGYYRRLVTHLISRDKSMDIDREILRQLELADRDGQLPSLPEARRLRDSADSLTRCLEASLRGRLLIAVKASLQRGGRESWFCLEGKPARKIEIAGPYDSRFGHTVDVCLPATDAVNVCFGANADGFWFGYMRSGEAKLPALEAAILPEAEKQLGAVDGNSDLWYAWAWTTEVDYDRCVDEAAAVQLAEALGKMRDSLAARLKT